MVWASRASSAAALPNFCKSAEEGEMAPSHVVQARAATAVMILKERTPTPCISIFFCGVASNGRAIPLQKQPASLGEVQIDTELWSPAASHVVRASWSRPTWSHRPGPAGTTWKPTDILEATELAPLWGCARGSGCARSPWDAPSAPAPVFRAPSQAPW